MKSQDSTVNIVNANIEANKTFWMTSSKIEVGNSYITSKETKGDGFIFMTKKSTLTIFNSTFDQISSEYGIAFL